MNENHYFLKDDESELNGVSIRAVDILQQKFSVKFRGYDVQDVDSFLEVVAREMGSLSNDNARMKDDILSLRSDLEQYKQKEESINAALVTVQKMADDVKSNASLEAEKVIFEAKKEADRIIAEAKNKLDAMKDEVNCLKGDAETEAQKAVNDARAEANRIKEEIHHERAKSEEEMQRDKIRLQTEINTLTQRKIQFQASLKMLIDTHNKLLETDTE